MASIVQSLLNVLLVIPSSFLRLNLNGSALLNTPKLYRHLARLWGSVFQQTKGVKMLDPKEIGIALDWAIKEGR